MEIDELAQYAASRHHLRQTRQQLFGNAMVLCDPSTGQWFAVLARQWDTDSGEEIHLCDLKCGPVREGDPPFLSAPFLVKQRDWAGIRLNAAEPDTVCRLLDRAVSMYQKSGHTILLPDRDSHSQVYSTTSLTQSHTISDMPTVPPQIQEMKKLYQFGDPSFAMTCQNFYRQGKAMENYEDTEFWSGRIDRPILTYHDLNLRQLRGYFAWRSCVRRGEYRYITPALVLMYISELICGIGVSSPEETIEKIEDLEKNYLGTGTGESYLHGTISQIKLQYAIVHGLPVDTARKFMSPDLLKTDLAMDVLRNPSEHTDDEILQALILIDPDKKLKQSPVTAKEPGMLPGLWRYMSNNYTKNEKDAFTLFFGSRIQVIWRPFSLFIYYEEHKPSETVYDLTPCRRYFFRNNTWYTDGYESYTFNRYLMGYLLHASDMRFRKVLKTGHLLKERPGDPVFLPVIDAYLDNREAEKHRVSIDLSGLEKIRQDARVTMDSLLTEEDLKEMEETAEEEPSAEKMQETEDAEAEKEDVQITEPGGIKSQDSLPDVSPALPAGLDSLHAHILYLLVHGQSPAKLIRDNRLMPSVAADTINDALMDMIGDSVVEADSGDEITLVEDYREEAAQLLGGYKP